MPDDKPELAVADVLTPLAMTILQAGGDVAYSRLVVTGGRGSEEGRRVLKGVKPEHLVNGDVKDAEAANALLAGLWLWHDGLDESHQISQSLVSSTGSFWHAIMHRREGDFSNAKYWYARCQTHPALRTIAVAAGDLAGDPATRSTQAGVNQAGVGEGFFVGNGFDPGRFVDWVEQIHEHAEDPGYAAAVELQRIEWRTLFADSAFVAAGKGSILGGGIES